MTSNDWGGGVNGSTIITTFALMLVLCMLNDFCLVRSLSSLALDMLVLCMLNDFLSKIFLKFSLKSHSKVFWYFPQIS